MIDEFRGFIRDIPDFPKPGIMFKDITPLLQNRVIFRKVIDHLAERYLDRGISKVVGVDARGFIFSAALAYAIGAGMVPVRKEKKLPHKTIKEIYELEYGSDIVEIHVDAIDRGEPVLVVDDLLATGGTLGATCQLVQKLGGNIVEVMTLIELSFLDGRKKLHNLPYYSVITY